MVLLEALKSPAFYVGALGSRGNTAKRKERLALFDLSPAEIERLHGPVGLDLGSKTPAEIAVSIVAEIVAVKNGVALVQKKEGSALPAIAERLRQRRLDAARCAGPQLLQRRTHCALQQRTRRQAGGPAAEQPGPRPAARPRPGAATAPWSRRSPHSGSGTRRRRHRCSTPASAGAALQHAARGATTPTPGRSAPPGRRAAARPARRRPGAAHTAAQTARPACASARPRRPARPARRH